MPDVILSDGTTPRRDDPRWPILVKTLYAVNGGVGTGLPENQPRRDDTRRILMQKILCSLDGVAYNG